MGERCLMKMGAEDCFMTHRHTDYTHCHAATFLSLSEDWNTELAMAIKAELKRRVNEFLDSEMPINPDATEDRLV